MDPADSKHAQRTHLALRVAPWLVLVLLIAFVGVTALSDEAFATTLRPLILGAVLIVAAVWFIACFTGDAESKLHHSFVFAYAFTFGAFALLLAPFVGSDNDRPRPASQESTVIPAVGVLQLVRGCIVAEVDGFPAQVSAVARCPQVAWSAQTEAALAVDKSAASAPSREVGHQYAWLVSIGGVTAKKFTPQAQENRGPPTQSYIEVHGGLAVPMYVIVLAFIGGAISLSRRIPEYQRRAEMRYIPTEKEPAMLAFQAREGVVFQLMQLTSAPFLAMATWYIVSPTTIASAAALAFGTGFASEPLLLMIRGMVEGIRPEAAKAPLRSSSGLRGTVLRRSTQAKVANATVKVQWMTGTETRTVTTDENGDFNFGVVPLGRILLTVSAADLAVERSLFIEERPMAALEIDLDAD